jgi:DHA2 family multidrug resistance protein-like MFS transporter
LLRIDIRSSDDVAELTNPIGVPPRATRREWIGLAVLTLAALVYAMDLTVLNLAVPRISEELRPTSVQLLWIIDIYGFLVAGLLITMGTLGDRIGRRKLLLGGAAGFALSSLLAAFSVSPEMLIASRALMGVFGATVAPSTLSLIFTMFRDPKQRSTAIGVWIAAYSAGGAIGPVLGGILLQFFWWGSVFLIGVPVMALLLVLGPRMLPEYKDPNARRLDLISAAMSIVAILGVVYGLKQFAQDGISTVPALTIAAGLLLGFMFVRRQLGITSPLIDVSLFRIRVLNASLATYLLGIFVVVGYFLFISQYLQLVLGMSPLSAALLELPSAIGFIVGSTVSPRLIHRYRPSAIFGTGMAVAAVGTVMLAALSVDGGIGSILVLIVASVLISFGLSPVITLATELIVGSAPPEQAGAATGVSETSGELGGALGIAILGSIGTALYRAEVADALPSGVPAAVTDAARDTLGGALTVAETLPAELAAAVVTAAQVAFVDALHLVAVVAAIGALVTAILTVAALWNVPVHTDEPEEGIASPPLPATD